MLAIITMGLPWWLSGKESACQCRRRVGSLGHKDSLEKEMATHSRHDLVTKQHYYHVLGRGDGFSPTTAQAEGVCLVNASV